MIQSAKKLMVSMLMLSSVLADKPTDADFDTCYGCVAKGAGGIGGQ